MSEHASVGPSGPPKARAERTKVLREQRGSAIVEFAIVLPILLVVILTAITALWMLAARSTLTGAARDGARFASIRVDPFECDLDCDGVYPQEYAEFPTASEVVTYVNSRAGGFGPVTVEVAPSSASRLPNDVITVRVRRPLPIVVDAVAGVFGWDELEYVAEAKVRAE